MKADNCGNPPGGRGSIPNRMGEITAPIFSALER